jgi:hypothetical protein
VAARPFSPVGPHLARRAPHTYRIRPPVLISPVGPHLARRAPHTYRIRPPVHPPPACSPDACGQLHGRPQGPSPVWINPDGRWGVLPGGGGYCRATTRVAPTISDHALRARGAHVVHHGDGGSGARPWWLPPRSPRHASSAPVPGLLMVSGLPEAWKLAAV